jgi:putative hydrolase of the HAD superfamily
MMILQAIFFDLFETLISEFDSGHPSAEDMANELGVDVEAFQRAYRHLQYDRYTGRFEDYPTVLRHILQRLGVEPNDRIITALYERRHAAMAQNLRQVEPEILGMLSQLREMGLLLGLISNTEGSEVATWETCPLADFFDVTAFSHEAGFVKPDPRLYTLAFRCLGVEPEPCLFVGDGGSDELNGAAGVGMTPCCAAWFLKRHIPLLGADIIARRSASFRVLYDVSELVSLVRSIELP